MPSSTPSQDTPIRSWIYKNLATVLLTVTLGLSSLVWQQVVRSMETMSTDIRALTKKIDEVVRNQATQRQIIESNRSDIREIEKRLRGHDDNWREQWRSESKSSSSSPNSQ